MPVTLLLVEDDVRQSEAMRSLFEESSADTTVIVAPTLNDALSHERSSVDAVLLDLGLPDSSGLGTLTAVLRRFAPVPVIVLTAAADAKLAEQSLALGADDYLPKALLPPVAIHRVVRYAIRHSAERVTAAERDAQNKAVAQLGQLALTDVPTATILNTVCEVIAHVLRVPNAMFMERTGDGFLLAKATLGCTTGQWPRVNIDEESPLGQAIRTNRAVRVDDIRRSDDSPTAAVFRELEAVSIVAVPVRTSFKAPEGALVVWRTELRPFRDDEASFLSAVANILAAAVQRDATQEALRVSRQDMEQILDAVPERIFRFDEKLRVQYMNRAAAQAMTVAKIGMQIDDFPIPSAYRARWRSLLQRALASGVTERLDIDGIQPSSRFDVSVTPMLHDGRPAVVVVLVDVTERVRAKARYKTLFASNVAGVFFCGSDGVITQANQAFLDMIGRPSADVAARRITLGNLMPPTAQAIHAARLREIREGGVFPPLPGALLHRGGATVPVLLASAVVESTPEEIVTFVIDETATRRAEVELRNQTLLLDSARDAIILRDAEGHVRFWNAGARRLYGWSHDEAVDRLMSDLISVTGVDTAAMIDASVMSSGEWQGEIQQHTRSGAQIVVDSRCSLIPSVYGEPPMMLIINTDITERKSLERQLLHAQRMESLGILAGGIAHDLNNILLPILMGAEYLRRIGLPSDAERTVDRIATSSRRGADIIRQLLTFARGHRADNEMTNPARLVAEVERMLRETTPPSIDIETDIDAEIWSIACDSTQVLQVLLNLGLNARDAMPGGGTLTIHAENVDIDAQYANMNAGAVPGAYVMLSVSDTGTGIPPEALDQIFDPFFSTKQAGAGTGLGLATARSIVKNHGGFINVYSEPGATVFKVYLPALYETASDREENAPPPSVSGNGELVLVVDDEMAIRDVTAATLESFGYRVLTASDGSEGIALYARNSDIAVVITDMLMPVLDGPTTIRALRKLNPNVRIIGMSGYTRQRTSGPAPDMMLQKPFRAADLLNAIHSILTLPGAPVAPAV
jgi:two-component system, cell cycle sensor histidine kinase and response regulator CckA